MKNVFCKTDDPSNENYYMYSTKNRKLFIFSDKTVHMYFAVVITELIPILISLTNKLKLFILKYFSLNHIAPNKIMLPLQGGVVTQGLKL